MTRERAIINRSDLILFLIDYATGHGIGKGLGGAMRIQKYVYFMQKPLSRKMFRFQVTATGPVSLSVYDSIEKLENMNYIKSEIVGEMCQDEQNETRYLLKETADIDEPGPEAFYEKHYSLIYPIAYNRIRKVTNDCGFAFDYYDQALNTYLRYNHYSLQSIIKEYWETIREGY